MQFKKLGFKTPLIEKSNQECKLSITSAEHYPCKQIHQQQVLIFALTVSQWRYHQPHPDYSISHNCESLPSQNVLYIEEIMSLELYLTVWKKKKSFVALIPDISGYSITIYNNISTSQPSSQTNASSISLSPMAYYPVTVSNSCSW